MGHKILVINPGSTSTKIALYEADKQVIKKSLEHSIQELAPFRHVAEQFDMRVGKVLDFLAESGWEASELSAVVGRGGLLKPIPGGTYKTNEKMLSVLRAGENGEHASNLGALIAHPLGLKVGIPSFIVDPVVVDELLPEARVAGLSMIQRKSIFHALNHRAVGRQAAEDLGSTYTKSRLVVVHMGGGITVGAHCAGRVIDVNDGLNGEGPFSPERAGGLPTWNMVELALSFTYNRDELRKLLMGNGGMVDYLGTNDMVEVIERIKGGDQQAELVVKAMAFQVAKEVGRMAAVLRGKVDAVVLTGGLAANGDFMEMLVPQVEWVGRVMVYPGEKEMDALANGALRVLTGKEEAREYVEE